MPVKTSEVLRLAREKISKKENWTRKAYARDEDGNRVDVESEDAVCFCSIGAIHRAASATDEFHMRYQALDRLQFDGRGNLRNIADWNDKATHERVLARFDRVIAALEAEGE